MQLELDMEKAKQGLVLSLQKAGIDASKLSMEILFALDVSGSFENEHKSGDTNNLLTRFVPWALTFDPDGKLDLLTYSDGPEHVCRVGEVTIDNYKDYIKKNVIGRVKGWNGGTDYSYVLERAMQIFGWLPGGEDDEAAPVAKKPGIFGSLFGKKEATPAPVASAAPNAPRKSLVIFITDGANSDHDRTRKILRASQKRGDDIYFLLIGYSKHGGRFEFLEEIADEFDNTGLVVVSNISNFVNQDDAKLNQQLLGEELVTWLGRDSK